jgi:hypothetical protein
VRGVGTDVPVEEKTAMPHPDPSPSPPRRPWVAPLAFGVAAALLAAGARAADPPDRSVDAPHGMRVTVKMIGPTA